MRPGWAAIAWRGSPGMLPAPELAPVHRTEKRSRAMMGILMGIILGVLGKLGYDWYRRGAAPESAGDLQRRATSILDESRQILQEVRQEVRSAAEIARES